MKRACLTALAAISGLSLVATIPWMLASCATTERGSGPEQEGSTLPDAATTEAGDADGTVDGGCDPSDPNCVTEPISCAEAEWCPAPTGMSSFFALTNVWGSGPNDVWASGSGGTVLHWDGAVWTPVPVPPPGSLPVKNTFRVLWGSGPNDVWLASATDVIFHTDGYKNGGAVWTPVATPIETGDVVPLYAGWGANGDIRFGGGSYAVVSPDSKVFNNFVGRAASGGGGWTWTPLEGSATVQAMWGSSADDVWILADNSRNLPYQIGLTRHGTRKSSADELVWKDVESQSGVALLGIWGSGPNDVWAVGESGTIRHFTGGPEWEIVSSSAGRTLRSVWGSGSNDVWAVGEAGAILHWDGAAWKSSVAAFPVNRTKPNLYGVWGSGPNDVWIVGDGIALHNTGERK
jgi:hypothetical protein